jgi:hypothetical protein
MFVQFFYPNYDLPSSFFFSSGAHRALDPDPSDVRHGLTRIQNKNQKTKKKTKQKNKKKTQKKSAQE